MPFVEWMISQVDWEVQQVVSLVSLMDQKLANSEPPTAPEFWQVYPATNPCSPRVMVACSGCGQNNRAK
jgi:hypothetical protein